MKPQHPEYEAGVLQPSFLVTIYLILHFELMRLYNSHDYHNLKTQELTLHIIKNNPLVAKPKSSTPLIPQPTIRQYPDPVSSTYFPSSQLISLRYILLALW
jgi:hypothetical protein